MDGKKNNFQSFADNLGVTPADETAESDMTLTIHRLAITKPVLQLEVKGLGLADGTIELADIELTNLGTDEKGQTPEEIARHISDALRPQIMKAITSTQGRNLLRKLTGGEGDTGDSVGDALKKGISGLLGKKKKDGEKEN